MGYAVAENDLFRHALRAAVPIVTSSRYSYHVSSVVHTVNGGIYDIHEIFAAVAMVMRLVSVHNVLGCQGADCNPEIRDGLRAQNHGHPHQT